MTSGFVVRTEKGTWWLIREGGELYETSWESKASIFDSIDEGQLALDEIRTLRPERKYVDAKIERVGLGWNYRSGGWNLKTPNLKAPIKVKLKSGEIVNGIYLLNDTHKKKYYHNLMIGIIPAEEIEAWRYWESSVDAPILDEAESETDSLEELSLENKALRGIVTDMLGACKQLCGMIGPQESEAIKEIVEDIKAVEVLLLGIGEGEPDSLECIEATVKWFRPPILPNAMEAVRVALPGEKFPQNAHYLYHYEEDKHYFSCNGHSLSAEEIEMWRYREILPDRKVNNV